MGSSVYAVYGLHGKVVGYTRYQNTADVMETDGIFRTSAEASPRTAQARIEDAWSKPSDEDIVVWIVEDFTTGDDGHALPIPVAELPKRGWRAWANLNLTVFTDTGFWTDERGEDYGYVDVVEPKGKGAKYYKPRRKA